MDKGEEWEQEEEKKGAGSKQETKGKEVAKPGTVSVFRKRGQEDSYLKTG